ncbi:MAG: hypothetical protein ACJA2Z_000029, partial [Candidatus Paceibacteria bacterium]
AIHDEYSFGPISPECGGRLICNAHDYIFLARPTPTHLIKWAVHE